MKVDNESRYRKYILMVDSESRCWNEVLELYITRKLFLMRVTGC